MNSSPVPVRIKISLSGSAPATLSICPSARWFCTLSWRGPPTVCALTSSTPSSRRLIVKKSLKNSLYWSNFGVGRNSCSDMRWFAFHGQTVAPREAGTNSLLCCGRTGCLHRGVLALGGFGGRHLRGRALPAQQLPRAVHDVLGAQPVLPEQERRGT